MGILNVLGYVLEIVLIAYFGFAALYVLVFAIAGHFKAKPLGKIMDKKRKFAVLIPGYKEDSVILEVASAALQQHYPQELYDVVVIADSFQKATLHALRAMPITLVEVSFEKSTKSKALNKAMAVIGNQYHVALVLDADNIMAPNFLEAVNGSFNKGHKVVQAHRAAKNTNTAFAILDAISEEINNHIFRKGHRALGLSSALIGSGMAFDYHFFKTTMAEVDAVGGFDKELELRLLKDKNTIEYLSDAMVLDEKVQKSDVFSNQRKRWLSAQFVYFRKYAFTGLKELLLRGNVDFADKVYQMVSPPRLLLLGLVGIITMGYGVLDIFVPQWQGAVPALLWYVAMASTLLGLLLSVPRHFYNMATVRALGTLPKAFMLMFLSLFKLKGANKKFIHTQHGTIHGN